MKTHVMPTIVMTLSLVALSAMAVSAQQGGGYSTKPAPTPSATHGKRAMANDQMTMDKTPSATHGKRAMSNDQMTMDKEPHHVLAMAYHRNLAAFTKALEGQTVGASSVNVDFARAAVAEMRRSFDKMKEHHQAHMQTMTAAMQATMSGMMQQMDTHQSELNTQLTALEQEVQLSSPDAKKVASLSVSVRAHLEAMKMRPEGKGSKMATTN